MQQQRLKELYFLYTNKQKKEKTEQKECKVPNRNAGKGHKMHAESNDYIGKYKTKWEEFVRKRQRKKISIATKYLLFGQ